MSAVRKFWRRNWALVGSSLVRHFPQRPRNVLTALRSTEAHGRIQIDYGAVMTFIISLTCVGTTGNRHLKEICYNSSKKKSSNSYSFNKNDTHTFFLWGGGISGKTCLSADTYITITSSGGWDTSTSIKWENHCKVNQKFIWKILGYKIIWKIFVCISLRNVSSVLVWLNSEKVP